MNQQAPSQAEMAKMTLELLNRVDLKGSEVGAFVAVSNWLNGLAVPVETPVLDQMLAKSTDPEPHKDDETT